MKRAVAVWIALVLFGTLPSPSFTAEAFRLDFAAAKTGELPAGWSMAKTGEGPDGVWGVVEDATAPGGKALAQTSDQGPNRLFCVCVADGTSFKDSDLTVSFKAVAGKLDQGGGPVWRYRDANNYYIARMNPLEHNYRVYKVVNGKRTQLGSADVKAPAGEWHLLRVVHRGDQIQCYLGDRLYLDVKDDTFGDAGKVGLWTKADAQTRFASLRVATAAQSLPQSCEDQLPSAPAGQTWKLVWQDEFDGDKLDATKWTPRPDGKRKGGWWSQEAVGLDGKGNLVIKTFMDSDKPTDGCITTQGKFEHSFGYYVARIQLQSQLGHWSAFWITGPGVGKVGDDARDGCEIDIMEKPWLDERVQHTFHWDGYGKEHKTEGKVAKVPGVMDGFHTFGLWWKSDEYVFYVDGKETWRSKAGGVCQVPEYMKLSDEIGDWAGDIKKAELPDAFLVDYVRVYDLVEKK